MAKLKKPQMVQEALQYLEVDPRWDTGRILIEVRKHLESQKTPEDQELVNFGEHKGKTFLEVRTKYPQYVSWCVGLYIQDQHQCCPGMQRLVRWAEDLPPPGAASSSRGRNPVGLQPKARARTTQVKEEPVEPPPRPRATAVKSKARPVPHHRLDAQDWMSVEVPVVDTDEEELLRDEL